MYGRVALALVVECLYLYARMVPLGLCDNTLTIMPPLEPLWSLTNTTGRRKSHVVAWNCYDRPSAVWSPTSVQYGRPSLVRSPSLCPASHLGSFDSQSLSPLSLWHLMIAENSSMVAYHSAYAWGTLMRGALFRHV